MRIPSQFNEDNLYRRRGAMRGETKNTYRRLLRLVLGLALVVVVMRQAAKPAIYRTFFGPQATNSHWTGGTPVTSSGPQSPTNTPKTTQAPQSPESNKSSQDRTIANQLVGQMPREDQMVWLVNLSRWQRGEPLEIPSTSLSKLIDILAANTSLSISSIQPTDITRWRVFFASLAEPNSQPEQADRLGKPLLASLLHALDDAAASRVIDGSVWRSSDFDRFYRCLDEAKLLPDRGVASTGVIPLLQQPEVFLDQLVVVHGAVARAEQLPAEDNPFQIQNYWQLWLRPSDGADRPLVAIVPTVPKIVAAVASDATATEGPPIAVVGRFVKRLAYQSALGADLAPIVIGRIISVPMTEEALPSTALVETDSIRLSMIIMVACIIGISLAVLLMWRTGSIAKRARDLRASHRKEPNDFLQDLGQHQSSATSFSDQEHP